MPRTQKLRGDEKIVTDQVKSFEEWGKLKMEVLKLKCNQYRLVSTGKKAEVQQRLTKHFATANEDSDIDVLASGMGVDASEDVEAHEEVDVDNFILMELRALQSEVRAVKQKQHEMGRQLLNPPGQVETMNRSTGSTHMTSTLNRPINPTAADITDNPMVIAPDHHNVANVQAVHEFQLPPFMRGDYTEVENPGMFPSNLNVMSGHSNPFILPPLPINILKKIEKNESVHFEDLLPNTLSVNTLGEDFID